jgi:hypothetical protein
VHAAERNDAGNAAARTDDHTAADLLAEDPVRRADVVASLRRDRRGLEAESVRADRLRGFVHDGVLRRAPGLQGEVEAGELDVETRDVRCEDTQRLLEQFLPGLVPLQHHDRFGVHRRGE